MVSLTLRFIEPNRYLKPLELNGVPQLSLFSQLNGVPQLTLFSQLFHHCICDILK